MTIADLHATHATESTPIGNAAEVHVYGQAAARQVRNGLSVHTGGRVTKRQKSVRRLRILNTAPILTAVTSNV